MAKKKNLPSTFLNMTIVLFMVTLVSSAALGYVYSLTKDRIKAAKDAKKLRAIQEVVIAGYDNSPFSERFNLKSRENETLECYPAKQGGSLTSVAIKTYSKKAFGGAIWLMVGLLPDGTINKVSVIEQKETPGLGTKIAESKFKSQFENKNPQIFKINVKKDGGDVDAITAATISSRAVCDAIERAYYAYIDLKKNLEFKNGRE